MTKKMLASCAVVCLVLTVFFMSLFISETKQAEDVAFGYLNSVHLYVQTQLLTSESLTQEEWEQRVGYLMMVGVGHGLDSGNKNGDCDKFINVIILLRNVEYEHHQEALELMRTLRISFDTYNNKVVVLEGDIDNVIQRLEMLQSA